MDKSRLIEVLSIPSYTQYEDGVRDYIIRFGVTHGIPTYIDSKGNVYLKKGKLDKDEKYPCVVAHMDTVHADQKELVGTSHKLDIKESKEEGLTILRAYHPFVYGMWDEPAQTGIGGDDKAGVAIALDLITQFDKIVGAFFVEEETGCWGSREADVDILADVGYFIQFDAPTDVWTSQTSSGVRLFDDEFEKKIQPLIDEYGLDIHRGDPFTDVCKLRPRFGVNCINYFAGYMAMHSQYEYVVVEYVEKAIKLGRETIELLGHKKYKYKN